MLMSGPLSYAGDRPNSAVSENSHPSYSAVGVAVVRLNVYLIVR